MARLTPGVAILIALLFGLTNLPWTLDEYDQAKQAYTSFEMVEQGHGIFQHTPNEKIATKPPLVGWISAAVYELTRSWEMAWRLPSLAAAVALLLLLKRAASRAFGPTAGLLAMSAFGLNLLSPRLATLVRTDMPLALVVFLIGLKIWEKLRTPWDRRDQWIFCGLLTAALMIKGPIIYAFLLPGLVAFQLWYRREKVSAWGGWWPWLVSLAIFLTWVGFGIARVPDFYDQVVLREFAGRFDETVHRAQPFYFYLPHLLHKFAPWSLFLFGGGLMSWRARKKISPEVFWLMAWSIGGLLVLSLIPSKRVDRIFPVVPPLCLLVGALVANLPGHFKKWSAIALLIACVFTSAYAAERIISAYRNDDGALVRFGGEVRRKAAANHWRYEVIGGKEEGLLLYLRRSHFAKRDDAIRLWNEGSLDAVVAPAAEAATFAGAKISLESAAIAGSESRRYILAEKN